VEGRRIHSWRGVVVGWRKVQKVERERRGQVKIELEGLSTKLLSEFFGRISWEFQVEKSRMRKPNFWDAGFVFQTGSFCFLATLFASLQNRGTAVLDYSLMDNDMSTLIL
jgi:hypothetical protein